MIFSNASIDDKVMLSWHIVGQFRTADVGHDTVHFVPSIIGQVRPSDSTRKIISIAPGRGAFNIYLWRPIFNSQSSRLFVT